MAPDDIPRRRTLGAALNALLRRDGLPAAMLMVVVTGQFSAGFEFSRISGFIRANIGNYLLAIVVWLVARFAAGFGILLLCIGLIFTGFWALTVAAYAFGQTYRLSSVR